MSPPACEEPSAVVLTGAAPRLALISKVRLYREGIGLALTAAGLEIVAECAQLPPPHTEHAVWSASVLVMDALGLDEGSSLDAMGLPVVVFGISEDDDTAIACARIGARGLIAAGDPLSELIVALGVVARGELHCSYRLSGLFVQEVARQRGRSLPTEHALTPREGEIALLLETGASNKAIARQLGIEVTTVKTHVHKVLSKLNVSGRSEAAARAGHRTLRVR